MSKYVKVLDMELQPKKTTAPNMLKLLPHQQKLSMNVHEVKFPYYMCWAMGSGKTIGGCVFLKCLRPRDRALVICDKSTIVQWRNEINRLFMKSACEVSI